ncbi:MAG: esterase-like activity of phytase family protein [Janthinobacterium lividum]
MRRPIALLASTLLLAAPAGATTLVGRAVLPSATFAPGPTSGQFITGANGVAVPFTDAQPVQGFSGIIAGPVPGTFGVLLDNGFGAKSNSADSVLRLFTVRPDFTTGQVTPVDTVTGAASSFGATNWYTTLSDPAAKAGFTIVANQATYPNGGNSVPVAASIRDGKLLTGADFDPEGVARGKDGSLYFGDEFGPFLLHTDAAGTLLSTPVPLPNLTGVGGNPLIQSPDYPTPAAGSALPGRTGASNAQGSGGFEGFTISPDKSRIYTVLEKGLTGGPGGTRYVNVFDTATGRFTDQLFRFRTGDPSGDNNGIDPAANSIGDVSMINDHQMLVLERDGGQGAASRFKRVYLVDLNQLDADGFARKTLLADLLNVSDPGNLGGNGTVAGVFTFPFTTIEEVIAIDANTILVGNDNNYPFSSGRTPGLADDNELALIRLDTMLDLDPSLVLPGVVPGIAAVPEPATLGLLGVALGLAGALRRRGRA